jgi:DNA polymerase-3 subunit delta'
MTEEAQNALLKTLEEPPRGSLILLVTDDPGSLLPTVRSRTPEIACGRLPAEVVAGALRRQELDAATAGWLAAWSEGSLGRALEAEADDLAARRALVRLLDAAVRGGDHLAAFGLLPQLTLEPEGQGDRVRRVRGMQLHLEILMLWYRDLAAAAQLGERAPLLNEDWRADILKTSRTLAPGTCRAMFNAVARQAAMLGPSSELRLSGEEMLVSLFDAHP